MSSTFSSAPVAISPVRVIVVEDNADLLEDLVLQLDTAGFLVRGAADGRQMDALLENEASDVVVLDVNLPFESGFEIAQRLRSKGLFGIIMLTGRSELDDRLQGLQNGADVYLVKPIDRRELIAHINSLCRRLQPVALVCVWQFDTQLRLVISPDGLQLSLTPQDVKILRVLHDNPGAVFSRKQIIQSLQIEFMSDPDGRINMMVSRLRQKLIEFDPSLRIQTWRNLGYSYVGPKLRQHC
ncbi:MAG: response regulator transcription factor [Polaromonas sp.]|jgi:two-component system response regulator TctD